MATSNSSARSFVVHDLGDWERDKLNTRSDRTGGSVQEYAAIDAVPSPARSQFEWMLEHGESVTQCGNTTYQIRNLHGQH